jgi:hypothetical protein
MLKISYLKKKSRSIARNAAELTCHVNFGNQDTDFPPTLGRKGDELYTTNAPEAKLRLPLYRVDRPPAFFRVAVNSTRIKMSRGLRGTLYEPLIDNLSLRKRRCLNKCFVQESSRTNTSEVSFCLSIHMPYRLPKNNEDIYKNLKEYTEKASVKT